MNAIGIQLICRMLIVVTIFMFPALLYAQSTHIRSDSMRGITESVTILERYIEAIGGRNTLSAIQDRRMESVERAYDLSGFDDKTGSFCLYINAYPNKMYSRSADAVEPMLTSILGDSCIYESWCDGTSIVETNMLYFYQRSLPGNTEKPYVKTEGLDLYRRLERNQLLPCLRFDSLGYKTRFLKKDIWDGTECYFIEVQQIYDTVTWVIDSEKYYLLSTIEINDEEAQIITSYSDFREVDGMVLPFRYSYQYIKKTATEQATLWVKFTNISIIHIRRRKHL